MKKLDSKSRLLCKGAINQLQLAMIDGNPTHALEMARQQITVVLSDLGDKGPRVTEDITGKTASK